MSKSVIVPRFGEKELMFKGDCDNMLEREAMEERDIVGGRDSDIAALLLDTPLIEGV